MSRTFFSLHRGRGYSSRQPAPLTMEDAGVVLAIGLRLFHLSSCIFFSSDDADQLRNESSRAVVRCQPDLSEARGLVLFRVIRRGIGITQRLGATGTVSSTGVWHTHSRTRASPEPTGHHQRRSPEMEGLFTRDAQAACDFIFSASKFLPAQEIAQLRYSTFSRFMTRDRSLTMVR